jgi:hypothetical protein
MTPEQEADLDDILSRFAQLCDRKYRAGQKEHGGNLFDLTLLQLIDHAIEESIDEFVYLIDARKKIEKGIECRIADITGLEGTKGTNG